MRIEMGWALNVKNIRDISRDEKHLNIFPYFIGINPDPSEKHTIQTGKFVANPFSPGILDKTNKHVFVLGF